MSPDPHKTSAIVAMERPKTPTELKRFMGVVNQLGKFIPYIADISQPLCVLPCSKKSWVWGPSQETAFVLALYDPDTELKISTDVSSYGLGAVLLQQHSATQWRPVPYASRSMSEIEQRYINKSKRRQLQLYGHARSLPTMLWGSEFG